MGWVDEPGNTAHLNWRQIACSAFFWGLDRLWLLPIRLPGGLERFVWASAAFAWRVAACKEHRDCEGRLSADKPNSCNVPQRLWEPNETDRADLDVRGTQEGRHKVFSHI